MVGRLIELDGARSMIWTHSGDSRPVSKGRN